LGAALAISFTHLATTMGDDGLKKYGGMTPIILQPTASACAASSLESVMDAAAMWLVMVTPCSAPAAIHASAMALRSFTDSDMLSPVVPLTAGVRGEGGGIAREGRADGAGISGVSGWLVGGADEAW
jgi:hypothetical protein